MKKGLVERFAPAEKIKMFFQLNWWLVWIANIAIVVAVYSMASKMTEENTAIKKLLEKEVQGVVFVGQNGQVIFSEKNKMDASTDTKFRTAVKNNLISYLLMDASRITQNYNLQIASADDVFNKYPPLKEFYENFISSDPKYKQGAVGYYKTMLAGVAQAIQQDNLPDQIVPVDSTISSYIWNDQEQVFDIVVNIKVNGYIYNAMLGSYEKKDGNVQIRAKGYFNIAENSTLNPLGIKYFQIGTTNASKR